MTKEEIKKYLEACGLSKANIETILSNEEYIKLLESNINKYKETVTNINSNIDPFKSFAGMNEYPIPEEKKKTTKKQKTSKKKVVKKK